MNREEAARVIESHAKHGVGTGLFGLPEAFTAAVTALRGPQPDPITGLVPCGCGGVTEQTDFHDGFFPHSKVECLECGIEMMRAGYTILEAHDEVKRDWNRAMSA